MALPPPALQALFHLLQMQMHSAGPCSPRCTACAVSTCYVPGTGEEQRAGARRRPLGRPQPSREGEALRSNMGQVQMVLWGRAKREVGGWPMGCACM